MKANKKGRTWRGWQLAEGGMGGDHVSFHGECGNKGEGKPALQPGHIVFRFVLNKKSETQTIE